MPESRVNYSENSKGAWLLIILAVYVVRIMPWAMSEYWYDEVLTFTEFSIRDLWDNVFRSYPIANNHILNSALYWCWVRIFDFNLQNEYLIRMPSILFGAGFIALVTLHWRRWIGDRLANIGGLFLAVSPVFTAYAYQVRGYSMSMFFGGLLLSGVLEYVEGAKVRGMITACVSCFLLPLVIPSNALAAVVAALLVFFSGSTLKDRMRRALPLLAATALGGSYYFTLWDSFRKAAAEPAGWESPWLVAGNLLLAFVAHGVVLIAAAVIAMVRCGKHKSETGENCELEFPRPTPQDATKHWSSIIFISTILITALVLAASRAGHAPYPRVFLVFLPAATLGLLLTARNCGAGRLSYPVIAVAVLLNGVLWERVTAERIDQQVLAGKSPNNLLEQYYRGAQDLRIAAELMADEGWIKGSRIMTDEYDMPTMSAYIGMNGGNPGNVVTVNRSSKGFWTGRPGMILAVAKTAEQAAEMFSHAGFGDSVELLEGMSRPGGMSRVAVCGRRALYAPPMEQPPKPRKMHPAARRNLV